jgi:hypothetical protein
MQAMPVAMAAISASWIALALFFQGLGTAFLALIPSRYRSGSYLEHSFVFGFSCLVIFLQLWNLFFPISFIAYIPLIPISAWGNARYYISLRETSRKRLLFLFRDALFWIAISIPLSNWSLAHGMPGDTGLYHIPFMNWVRTYPLPVGLGNLHGRLAFNNSYYLYGASLWRIPGLDASHLCHGPFFLILLRIICKSLYKTIFFADKVRLSDLFILGISPYLIHLTRGYLNSYASDLMVFVLSVSIIVIFIEYLYGSQINPYALILLLFMSLSAIMVKISSLGLVGPISLLALIWYIKRGNAEAVRGRNLVGIGALSFLGLWGWVWRSVLASGYLIYPISWLPVPVSWRVPSEKVAEEARWIVSWARAPGEHWADVLGNSRWLLPWIEHHVARWFDVSFPVALAVLMLVVALLRRVLTSPSKTVKGNFAFAAVFVSILANIAYWFLTAPGSRFSIGLFWFLFAFSFSSALYCDQRWSRGIIARIALCITLGLYMPVIHRMSFFYGPEQRRITPTVELNEFITDSGLLLFVPAKGYSCWESPLPCTPYPDSALRLRRSGDLSSGFEIRVKE